MLTSEGYCREVDFVCCLCNILTWLHMIEGFLTHLFTGTNVLLASSSITKRSILLSTWRSHTTQFISLDAGCVWSTVNLLNHWGSMLLVRYYFICILIQSI